MGDSTTGSKGIGALPALQKAELRRSFDRRRGQARDRILTAAKVDPETLSDQAQRVLDWLAEGSTVTVEGVIELFVAARVGVYVEWERAEIDHKNQALRDSSARLDAAMAHHDARCGAEPKGVEL